MLPQVKVLALATILLLLPGIALTISRRRSGMMPDTALALGTATGVAVGVVTAWLMALAGMVGLTIWVWSGWAVTAVGSWFYFRFRDRDAGPVVVIPAERRQLRWLAVGVLAVMAAEAVPVLSSCWPPGWDTSFHSLLAQKILLGGGLSADWRPFENIPLNYPQGLHAFAAAMAVAGDVKPHEALQTFHLLFQVPAAILVMVLARTVFGRTAVAFAALLSYAFLAEWGSFYSYYQWGGLPTELAFMLFLALLRLAWLDRPHFGLRVLWGVLFMGTILIVHHLTMVMVVAVIAVHATFALARMRRLDLTGRFMLTTGIATALAFGFYLYPYVLRVTTIGQTGTLKFYDEAVTSLTALPFLLGIFMFAGGLVGMCGAASGSGDAEFEPEHGRERCRFLWSWLGTLAGGFLFFDYFYRYVIAGMIYQDNFTAFTPSRWATAIAYPLSIFSGYGFYLPARQGMGRGRRWKVGMAAVAIVILGWGIWRTVSLVWKTRPDREVLLRVAAVVDKNTPKNSFILLSREIGDQYWFPYMAWRPCLANPIPASENRIQLYRKIILFKDLNGNRSAIRQWLRENNLFCYLVRLRNDGTPELLPVE